jgi:hypothetical protein
LFWVKIVAAFCLLAFGLSASREFGFWIQSHFLGNASGLDERAALYSAVISTLLLGLSAFPACFLIFKRLNHKEDRRDSARSEGVGNAPAEVPETSVRDHVREEIEKRQFATASSGDVPHQFGALSKPSIENGAATMLQKPAAISSEASLTRKSGTITLNPRIQLILEYSDEASRAWDAVQKLPAEYQEEFLSALEANPKLNAPSLLSTLIEAHKKSVRPLDNNAANDVLENVRALSKEAEQEFLEVYSLLGEKVALVDIVSKIEKKYGALHREQDRGSPHCEENTEFQRRASERKAYDEKFQAFRMANRLEEQRLKERTERLEQERLARVRKFGIFSVFLSRSGFAFMIFLIIFAVLWFS